MWRNEIRVVAFTAADDVQGCDVFAVRRGCASGDGTAYTMPKGREDLAVLRQISGPEGFHH